MRKILFFALCALSSCNIEYDGETRLVSQSRVVDTGGNPVAGKKIKVVVSDNGISDVISDGRTDENGVATFVFPAPSDLNANIGVVVEQTGDGFVEKSVLNIRRGDFTNYKFTLDNLVLFKADEVTALEIALFNTTAGTEITSVSLVDNPAESQLYWNPSEQQELTTWFQVPKNTTVILKYVVQNNNVNPASSTTYTVPVEIGGGVTNFTITY